MKQYKEVAAYFQATSDSKYYEDKLNDYAKEGYKIIAVIPGTGHVTSSRVIMEREIPDLK